MTNISKKNISFIKKNYIYNNFYIILLKPFSLCNNNLPGVEIIKSILFLSDFF